MGTALDQTYEVINTLNRATASQDICDALTRFTGRYGVTCMLAGALPSDSAPIRDHDLLVSAYPSGWMARYFEQNYGPSDPVIRRLSRDPTGFFWDSTMADDARSRQMFGEAEDHKLHAGIALPVPTLDGTIVGVSFGGETIDVPPNAFGMLNMVSTFAIARALDLRNRRERKCPGITPREVECLRWAADGKTEWEISAILNISEHTAAKHFANAQRKLGAANRAHAVALAIRWGFIS